MNEYDRNIVSLLSKLFMASVHILSLSKNQHVNRRHEEFRKQTDYFSIVFIHTERGRAGALVLVSLQGGTGI